MSCDPLAGYRGVVREPPRRQGRASAGSHETNGSRRSQVALRSFHIEEETFSYTMVRIFICMDVYPEELVVKFFIENLYYEDKKIGLLDELQYNVR